jgi:hypothetical protein
MEPGEVRNAIRYYGWNPIGHEGFKSLRHQMMDGVLLDKDLIFTQSRSAAMISALELNLRARRTCPLLLSAAAEANGHGAVVERHHPIHHSTRRDISILTETPEDAPALPALFVSTSREAAGGTHSAASGRGRLVADPLPAMISTCATSERLRATPWQHTEHMLGVRLDVA